MDYPPVGVVARKDESRSGWVYSGARSRKIFFWPEICAASAVKAVKKRGRSRGPLRAWVEDFTPPL
jgi:hypothetical protein